MDSKAILNEALQLKPAERLLLLELLAKSLNKPDEKTEDVWKTEAEERFKSLIEGKVKTIPLEEIVNRYNNAG